MYRIHRSLLEITFSPFPACLRSWVGQSFPQIWFYFYCARVIQGLSPPGSTLARHNPPPPFSLCRHNRILKWSMFVFSVLGKWHLPRNPPSFQYRSFVGYHLGFESLGSHHQPWSLVDYICRCSWRRNEKLIQNGTFADLLINKVRPV